MDEVAYTVEFDKLNQIHQRFGPEGIRNPVYVEGKLVVSDDTQMTLFTLEGVIRSGQVEDVEQLNGEISRAYDDWLDTQGGQVHGFEPCGTLATRKAMRHCRAPGNTCMSALKSGTDGTLDNPINRSKGCGAVMRVAPIGWGLTSDYTQAFKAACNAGVLTHGHPDGWVPAGMLSSIIWILFSGLEISNALARTKIIADYQNELMGVEADTVSKVARAEVLAEERPNEPTKAIAELGEGWVGDEALAIAVYAALSASSFEDAVQRAANHDGDSDSTASIAGQIWGASKGIDALPIAWVRRLDVLAECLHGVRQIAAQGYRATPIVSEVSDSKETPEDQRLLGQYPKNARSWPDDQAIIASLLHARFDLRENIHTQRLARAVRNQLGYFKGIGTAPVGLMRFGIWANHISEELSEGELRKHLKAFAEIQSELGDK